jgi:UDP-N-acetylmuramoylalanine--D-glutamate ligase
VAYLDTLKNKVIGVLGLGVSGLCCVSFLLENQLTPFVMDSNLSSKGVKQVTTQWPQLCVYHHKDDAAKLLEADLLIISPGIALSTPALVEARQHGVEIIGDIELFARINTKPVIAITGSNGKTTVTQLVTKLLKHGGINAVYGGNIGVPVMDLLQQSFDVAVLELSSFQLETTSSLKPVCATMLNVVEDHMDRYDGFAEYVLTKQRIYDNSQTCVFSRHDQQTVPNSEQYASCSFGLDVPKLNHIGIKDGFFVDGDKGPICPLESLSVVGEHNVLNALAALALVKPFAITNESVEQTFIEFTGLAHRCELVPDTGVVKWINDSKATNVGATIAALNGIKPLIKGRLILIAGGAGKDADFTPLQSVLQKSVDHLITFGRDGEQIANLLAQTQKAVSLEDAVQKAYAIAVEDDCVLLSPACASTDMFTNYEVRGDRFKTLVKEINHV